MKYHFNTSRKMRSGGGGGGEKVVSERSLCPRTWLNRAYPYEDNAYESYEWKNEWLGVVNPAPRD